MEFKAKFIKYNWVSDDERLIAKCQELETLKLANNVRKPKGYLDAFIVILTSFDVLDAYNGRQLFIATNNNLFSGKTQRDKTHTHKVLECLLWLIDEGYLVKEHGKTSYMQKRKIKYLPSRYSVSTKLSDRSLSHPKSIRRNPLADYVQLRQNFKAGKRALKLADVDTSSYEGMLNETSQALTAYDELMRNTEIRLGSKLVPSAQTSMTRIFSNGSFEDGGRLYSSFQGLKSEARKYLRFNGEPTIEIDYATIHPVMLYNEIGKEMVGDPYVVDGFYRKQGKAAFNILINRKSKTPSAKTISEELEINIERARVLEKRLLDKHAAIYKSFSTGHGLKLQKKDSDLALEIIKLFVASNKPIITIHDSAVVAIRDVADLKLAMAECFMRIYGYKYENFSTLKIESLEFSHELMMLTEGIVSERYEVKQILSTLISLLEIEPVKEVPSTINVDSYTINALEEHQ